MQKEIDKTILKNNEIREKKEEIYEQLITEQAKYASLTARLVELKKKDYRKVFINLLEYISDVNKDPETYKSKYGYASVLEFNNKYYYKLMHFSKNKTCDKNQYNKKVGSQDTNINFKEVIVILNEWECDLNSISENIKENAANDHAFQEQKFYQKFYIPLTELFECKQIKADIKKQEEIVEKKRGELNNCRFEKIDSLKIKIKKAVLNEGIGHLKTQKQ